MTMSVTMIMFTILFRCKLFSTVGVIELICRQHCSFMRDRSYRDRYRVAMFR
jgi:hypothetical protein